MKIESHKFGIIHYIAQCQDCDWDCGIGKYFSPQQVRNEVYKHIRKTSHRVQVEGGTSTDYYPR